MKRSKTSLTQKLFGNYFALSLITIFILSLYSYSTSKDALISRTYDQLTSVKFEKERNIENYFLERMDEVNQISRYENWSVIIEKYDIFKSGKINEENYRSLILSEYKEKIAKHLSEKINFKNIIFKTQDMQFIINLKGKMQLKNVALSEMFVPDINIDEIKIANHVTFLEDLVNKKIYLGDLIKSNHSNLSDCIILMEIDMASINSIMFNTNVLNGLGKTGEAYVVGSDRIMRTSSRFKSNSINKTEVKTFAVEKSLHNITGTGEYKDYRDITVLGSYGKINIPGLNWAIIVEIDLEEAMIPIYTLRNSIIILSLIISIIIFGIVYIISRRVSSPILKLKMAADSISQGNYDTQLETNSTDEIGDLTLAFNKMVAKIKMQTAEIQIERSKRITSVIDGQEQERQRLSRELHDGLGQRILAVKMKLERAENAAPDLKLKIIEDAKDLLIAVSKEVVSISENLMPPVLTQFGLICAIENLCEDVRTAKDICINFNYNDIPEKCDDNIKIYLYRIIQEALNNVVKHADASKVDISFIFENNYINLVIADNGNGFDSEQKRKTGNGIYNMHDRAEIIGGTFNLISSPGSGTIINVIIEING